MSKKTKKKTGGNGKAAADATTKAAPETSDPSRIQIEELADGLVRQLLRFVKGEGPEKIRAMSELKARLIHYAAKGDAEGMDLVYGRMAGELVDAKLDVESEFEAALRFAGDFLLDAAEKVLPRIIARLEAVLLTEKTEP